MPSAAAISLTEWLRTATAPRARAIALRLFSATCCAVKQTKAQRLDSKASRAQRSSSSACLSQSPALLLMLRLYLQARGRGSKRGDRPRCLREKIEAAPANPTRVETVWGMGYRFRA